MRDSNSTSPESRATPRKLALLLALIALPMVILLLVVGLAMERNLHGPGMVVREIQFSARDGKFNGSNPPLELRMGETVAITVVNQDPEASYDFRIPKLNVRTGFLAPGASERVVFKPSRPGAFVYSCTLHPGEMDGEVVVRD